MIREREIRVVPMTSSKIAAIERLVILNLEKNVISPRLLTDVILVTLSSEILRKIQSRIAVSILLLSA